MAPSTPDRSPGALEEDEELRFGTNAGGPSVAGAIAYDGSSFRLRDASGTYDPRPMASTDRAFRRHFMLMGG